MGDRVAECVALEMADVRLTARVREHLEHVGVARAPAGVVSVGDLPRALSRPQLLPTPLDLKGIVLEGGHRAAG